MKLTFIGFFLLVLTVGGFAQQAYKIDFKVNGLKDTTIYLGYYQGESTYIKDTARVSAKGEFSFFGKDKLHQGIYFLVINKNKLPFDMVMGKSQTFSMTTDTADYVKNMVVKGDPDNKIFFEQMMFNMERHKEAEPLLKVLQDSSLNEEAKKPARESFAKINDKVMAYQDQIISQYPETVTARILKSNKAVKIPEPPKNPDGSIDSTFQLRWYREHFFDNFNLADDAFLRMPRPVYQEKIYEYLEKLYAPIPDTLKKALDKMIAKAKPNQETYKYAVWMAVMKYQAPEIMGLDEVYVHLYDKYFASGEMDFWVNAKMKKNLKDQADRIRKSLVGRTAQNLIMLDKDLKPRSLFDLKNKYSIVFFFDPDCGHCKEETPKLVNFYNANKKKYDIEIYAVSADTSMVKMKKYITDMKMPWITVNGPRTYVGSYQDLYDANTTPTLYILDDKKKIIGKKLPVDQLDEFFTQHERMLKTKAAASKM